MLDRLKVEPAALLALVRAVIVLGTAFGLDLTMEQTAAIYAFVEVVTTILTRQNVIPVERFKTNRKNVLHKDKDKRGDS